MKARNPSDPRSWFFQAAIHGVSQELIDQALAADPDVAKVDQARFWNQCPHSGQPSADFLVWHRAYLFYFERILQDAAGDATLSVPYWAYSEQEKGFPPVFADPDPDPGTGIPRNVNLPKDSVPEPSSANFVGTLAVFGLQHEHQRQRPSVQSFDITDLLLKQGGDPQQVTVTIVPFDLLKPRRGDTPPVRRSGNVTVDSIAVVVAEAAQPK